MLPAIELLMGGKAIIDMHIAAGYSKYSAAGLSESQLLTSISIIQVEQVKKLPQCTKMFFFEDYYTYWYNYHGKAEYGVGKDPDLNDYFKPYEE